MIRLNMQISDVSGDGRDQTVVPLTMVGTMDASASIVAAVLRKAADDLDPQQPRPTHRSA